MISVIKYEKNLWKICEKSIGNIGIGKSISSIVH